MNEKVREAIFRQVEREPFAKKFGLRLVDLQAGYSKVEMTFSPDMENIFGMAHGGALFALIDEAFETAANSHGTMAVALGIARMIDHGTIVVIFPDRGDRYLSTMQFRSVCAKCPP